MKIIDRMDRVTEELPARCSGCGKHSEPRKLGTAPKGWKLVRADDGRKSYLCPDCSSIFPARRQA